MRRQAVRLGNNAEIGKQWRETLLPGGSTLRRDRDRRIEGKRLPKEEGIQRYKGLGEMNADELWETTMDPAHRLLRQVTLDDAAAADEMFAILMGEDVDSRRSFIQRNAKDVRFLDI